MGEKQLEEVIVEQKDGNWLLKIYFSEREEFERFRCAFSGIDDKSSIAKKLRSMANGILDSE